MAKRLIYPLGPDRPPWGSGPTATARSAAGTARPVVPPALIAGQACEAALCQLAAETPHPSSPTSSASRRRPRHGWAELVA
jgi:hypothetical protein